jgi:hypothetical protein
MSNINASELDNIGVIIRMDRCVKILVFKVVNIIS